jgi:hypothetical protein
MHLGVVPKKTAARLKLAEERGARHHPVRSDFDRYVAQHGRPR